MFASGIHIIVTICARRIADIGMIKGHFPSIASVTSLTGQVGQDVPHRFTMTTVAAAQGMIMVYTDHRSPSQSRVTGIAGITGIDMGVRLTRLIGIVVTTKTRTENFLMVHHAIVEPGLGREMAGFANIGAGYMVL